jgi:TetR/AcrR family transcriptional regulator, cholesterol catabolism regulator
MEKAVARADNRADQIIRVGAKLFSQRGFAATTVRDLAKELGISSGSVFHHFDTKEDILVAVVERGLAGTIERIDGMLEGVDDPKERVTKMILAHLISLHRGDPETMSVLFFEWWSLSAETKAKIVSLRDAYEARWVAEIARLSEVGLAPKDPSLFRLFIFGSMNWSAQWYHVDYEQSVEEVAAYLAALFLR